MTGCFVQRLNESCLHNNRMKVSLKKIIVKVFAVASSNFNANLTLFRVVPNY